MTMMIRARSFLTVILLILAAKGRAVMGKDTVTQAVTRQAADAVHGQGILGQGVKACVISANACNYQEAIALGDLPNGTTILVDNCNTTSPWNEGTAMMELVYDMAPEVELFYATVDAYGEDREAFTKAVELCVEAGVDVIIDDVWIAFYPMLQVSNSTLSYLLYTDEKYGLTFSAAQNWGGYSRNTGNAWDGTFKADSNGFLEWAPGIIDNTFTRSTLQPMQPRFASGISGAGFRVEWAESRNEPLETAFEPSIWCRQDANSPYVEQTSCRYLLLEAGVPWVLFGFVNSWVNCSYVPDVPLVPGGTLGAGRDPLFTNPLCSLRVKRVSGTGTPYTKVLIRYHGEFGRSLEIRTNIGTCDGQHQCPPDPHYASFAVAAVNWWGITPDNAFNDLAMEPNPTGPTSPYNNADAEEQDLQVSSYSSGVKGLTLFFDAEGNPYDPPKPVCFPFMASVSGGDTTSPGWVGSPVFTGTSAAAPGLGGIAVLAITKWELYNANAGSDAKGEAPPPGPSRIRQQTVRDAMVYGAIPMSAEARADPGFPPNKPHPDPFAGYGMAMADRIVQNLEAGCSKLTETIDPAYDEAVEACAGTTAGRTCDIGCGILTCRIVAPGEATFALSASNTCAPTTLSPTTLSPTTSDGNALPIDTGLASFTIVVALCLLG